MSRFAAVLFDMDGVLVDSEPHWQDFWREEVFTAADGDPSLAEVTGRNYREGIADIHGKYGLDGGPEPYIEAFEAASGRVYGEHVTLTPGVDALFRALRERGLQVAIVSSSPTAWIERVVERFGLEPDAIVSAEDIDGPGKPEPGIYEHAAERLGVDPVDCLVVEDSEHGISAASAAGCTVVRFARGVSVERVPGIEAVAGTPAELRERMFGLLNR
jgi:HAD superfamily hydrolase (TIGR01509 family)